MAEAYIVDAVRTPVGRRGGGLSAVHPADLGAHSLKALMERTGVDPGAVEDVIFGCVDTIGGPVSYTHLRAHETVLDLVCRLLLEKKKNTTSTNQEQ